MEKRYYQIGQVCKLTELTHSTIRFWEKNFQGLRPSRSSGGHRYYDSDQVNLLLYLKKLIYDEGYTIDGAKKRLISEKTSNDIVEPEIDLMQKVKMELREILGVLNG